LGEKCPMLQYMKQIPPIRRDNKTDWKGNTPYKGDWEGEKGVGMTDCYPPNKNTRTRLWVNGGEKAPPEFQQGNPEEALYHPIKGKQCL